MRISDKMDRVLLWVNLSIGKHLGLCLGYRNGLIWHVWCITSLALKCYSKQTGQLAES